MTIAANNRFKIYYATSIFSVLFAVMGFIYNTWRLELSEQNTTVRVASFEVITAVSELEQNIFAAVYDDDPIAGSPRIGWIKVGLIQDLSVLIAPEVETAAAELKQTWTVNWANISSDEQALAQVSDKIEQLRARLNAVLKSLN